MPRKKKAPIPPKSPKDTKDKPKDKKEPADKDNKKKPKKKIIKKVNKKPIQNVKSSPTPIKRANLSSY
tara:strand:+ start:295 stop:498 length:204 start_codon:yes stop_codon:yes gene_type:complete